jgi:hypothetical protein
MSAYFRLHKTIKARYCTRSWPVSPTEHRALSLLCCFILTFPFYFLLGSKNDRFPMGFLIKILYAFLFPNRVTFLALCNVLHYTDGPKYVNWLVKYTKNSLEMSLSLTEFTKIVRNEILHVQCTTQRLCNTVLQIDWQV